MVAAAERAEVSTTRDPHNGWIIRHHLPRRLRFKERECARAWGKLGKALAKFMDYGSKGPGFSLKPFSEADISNSSRGIYRTKQIGLSGLARKAYRSGFKDFSHNRNVAIQCAKTRATQPPKPPSLMSQLEDATIRVWRDNKQLMEKGQ